MKRFIIFSLMMAGGMISAQEKINGDIFRAESVGSVSSNANQLIYPHKVKHSPGLLGHRMKRIDKAKFSSGMHLHPHKFRY